MEFFWRMDSPPLNWSAAEEWHRRCCASEESGSFRLGAENLLSWAFNRNCAVQPENTKGITFGLGGSIMEMYADRGDTPPVDLVEEMRMRAWARRHYQPATQRDSRWHPVILDEMSRRDREMVG